jgi:hypothetical protein
VYRTSPKTFKKNKPKMKTSIFSLSVILSIMITGCWSAVGLSRNTAGFTAQSYVPLGDLTKMQPGSSQNGWTIEMWITYQPAVPLPARTRILFSQVAINFCAVLNAAQDNFQYSMNINPAGFLNANVQWCTGSLSLTALDLIPGGGVWTHVAVVFRKQQGIFIYYDGKLVRSSSQLMPNDPNIVAFTGAFSNNGTILMFDDSGLIDEVRFWDRARTTSDVEASYCRRLPASFGSGLNWLVDFDSNLAQDGTTRIYLNETFDLTSGRNHLAISPPLSASDLPQVENTQWCSNGQSAGAIAVATVIPAVSAMALITTIIVVSVMHNTVRDREKNAIHEQRPKSKKEKK